jgi:type III secretion protein C
MTITPILGMNDIITIDITNDISAQVANTTSGVNGIQGLQTSHTSLSARVHVPNNHFVAISGVLQDEKTHFKSSIPCLGGLPVIGAFFSENDRLNSKNNLIFFIRPSIIDSVEEFEKITSCQEGLYKQQAVKQIVKEEIDDGINWIDCHPIE